MEQFSIESLISGIAGADEYMKTIFLNGGCWKFHKFLKSIFQSAEPYKVATTQNGGFDHIITKYDGKFYDITGEVLPSQYYVCVVVEDSDALLFDTWSFGRNAVLFRRCPYCGEEIMIDNDCEIVKNVI